MLVSFSKRIVFIKTKKTASTSTEALLESAIWNGGLVEFHGWIVHRDGFVTPRPRGKMTLSQRGRTLCWPKSVLVAKADVGSLVNHSSPREISSALGKEQWGQSTKIANVRNPFSLMVSWFFFNSGRGRGWGIDNTRDLKKAFASFIHTHFEQADWQEDLTDYEDISFRYIRYECLKSDLEVLGSELGLRLTDLPAFKSEFRPNKAVSYRNLFDSTAR